MIATTKILPKNTFRSGFIVVEIKIIPPMTPKLTTANTTLMIATTVIVLLLFFSSRVCADTISGGGETGEDDLKMSGLKSNLSSDDIFFLHLSFLLIKRLSRVNKHCSVPGKVRINILRC